MTPAEVIEMHDKLADEYAHIATDWDYEFSQFQKGEGEDPGPKADHVATWLIATGWVVAPPKNEGENNGQHCDGA